MLGDGTTDALPTAQGAIMARTKPILAVSSFGLGVALLLVAVNIQRDRFAFTAQNQRNSDALTSAMFELAVPTLAMPTPASFSEAIPVVALEELEVLPEVPRRTRARPVAKAQSAEPAPVTCNPGWRELESGPAGRMVRDIC
jgi:hypothetical protein